MDRPLINLAFSGNGQLDKAVIDLMEEIDARVYILDCLPNLGGRASHSAEEVYNRILYAVRALKKRRPDVPVVLASHAGYTEEAINLLRRNSYRETNSILDRAFAQLKAEGVRDIFYIPKEDFGQDIETMVDGTHPNDIGMMRYAEGYEKHLRYALREQVGESVTARPRTQYREPGTYDWELRHREILRQIRTDPPKTVLIGNSITHYWGGMPRAPIARGEKSFVQTFGSRGVVNLAYGWDRIENALWRVHHGELDGFSARNVLINIGTNNLHLNTDEEIIAGWRVLLAAVKARQPEAAITMIGIYPRRQQEERVKALNLKMAQVCGDLNVNYADVGKVFLQADGKIDESLFSDGLHPNAKGYDALGAALKPWLK